MAVNTTATVLHHAVPGISAGVGDALLGGVGGRAQPQVDEQSVVTVAPSPGRLAIGRNNRLRLATNPSNWRF